MSKITMPEPVAWGIYNPTFRSYELSKEKVETKYRDDGTVVYVVVPFITTDQAEAYVTAKVREALEEAAALCDRFAERNMHPEECAGAIRTLIPKEST